jgi:hypothetical protein
MPRSAWYLASARALSRPHKIALPRRLLTRQSHFRRRYVSTTSSTEHRCGLFVQLLSATDVPLSMANLLLEGRNSTGRSLRAAWSVQMRSIRTFALKDNHLLTKLDYLDSWAFGARALACGPAGSVGVDP